MGGVDLNKLVEQVGQHDGAIRELHDRQDETDAKVDRLEQLVRAWRERTDQQHETLMTAVVSVGSQVSTVAANNATAGVALKLARSNLSALSGPMASLLVVLLGAFAAAFLAACWWAATHH